LWQYQIGPRQPQNRVRAQRDGWADHSFGRRFNSWKGAIMAGLDILGGNTVEAGGHNTSGDSETNIGSGNKQGDTNIGSGNRDDHSDRHDQTTIAGGNVTDRHDVSNQTNVGGTVINMPANEEVTRHPDGTTTFAPHHQGGGGGGHAHNYPHLGSHDAGVEHWKRQLNAVMNAGLIDNQMFDQDTHDWTVYFQQQNGLAADGVVGPATQGAMDAQYVPQPHHQGGGQEGPWHPSTHGPFDPSQHGPYDPNEHGQFDPQLHGDFNPYVHGQFDPQMHGDFNPYVHGQFNPEYHGQYDPQIHGQFHPEYHGQYDPQIHGQYHPEYHGQYDPQIHGQFDENIHGRFDASLHGEHNPSIHGELAIN